MRRKNLSFLFLLLLGASIIVATGNLSSGIGRFIAFCALLLVCYSLFRLFQNSDDILKSMLPLKNWIDAIPNKIIYILSTVIFFLGLGLMVSEILNFGNVLRPSDFWKMYYPLGCIISLVIIFTLPSVSKDLYASRKRRFSIFWGLLIGIPFVILSLSSKGNRLMASENTHKKTFQVLEKSTSTIRRSDKLQYFLTVPTGEGSTKDVQVEPSVYENAAIGSSLTLQLKEGYLGFEIIEEIKN